MLLTAHRQRRSCPGGKRTDLQERIIELEKRVAYLDMQIEELTDVINRQEKALGILQKKLTDLSEQMDSGALVKPLEDEVPPPHY